MPKKYIAEFIGTFALAFIVLVGIAFTGNLALGVPVIAGLTLGLFVYIIGPISGCHINPAVTLGLLSVRKISRSEALNYIMAQLMAALLAKLVASYFDILSPMTESFFSLKIFGAETLGAFFFCFGIGSVVFGRAKDQMAGVVIGGSLTLGVLVSSLSGAAGILNPAVALAINSFTILYVAAPIIGGVLGFKAYEYIAK